MKPVEVEILMKDRLSGALDKAVRKVDELKGKTSGASSEMERLNRQADSVRSTVSKIAGAFAVKELVSNIVKVRGEFQQLEASFDIMLGSKEKADALMQQLIRTAATTPFDLQSVAQGARQLLAYGENVENVNDDLIRLGNIAAGLNQPLGDLVYLYGTTMTQGRLYTQDFNQFVGRGIPLGRELAGILGVAESKVREMVEAGKVGFPEVQRALQNLTNEGGTFYNLMEEQSKTITGRISNIEDSISMMFNEIGRQSEGIINESLDSVAYLVENYEQVGRVLLGLVGTYGTYKTALMAVMAMQSLHTTQMILQTAGVSALTVSETLHYGWLVLVEKAQKLLNATMLSNPYVLVATLIAGTVAALMSMKTETERMREAEEEYQAAKQKTIEAEEEHRRRLEELCNVAGDESLATDTRREALNKLEQKYPDIFAKYDTEYDKLRNIRRIKEEIAGLEADRSITNPDNELAAVEARIKELERRKADVKFTTAYSSAGSYAMKSGGLNIQQEAELQNLYNKREALSEQVRKERVNAYFEDLTGVSNDTLEAEIKQRKNLLARLTTERKNYGKIVNGNPELAGTFSRDELQYQLNKLQSEQNRRNLKQGSSTDWGASARKNYEEALKAYNDFLADTTNVLSQEEYEKKVKELKDALSLAKKESDKTRPDGETSDRKKSEKQARQKLNDELLALEQQNQQDWLDLQEEGTQKKLARIDADYERQKAEIEKKARELAELNRKAGITGTNAAGLTGEQQTEIDRANTLAEDTREKERTAVYREEAVAMRDYLKEYGSYQQQKLAIAEEYAEKIRRAQSEGERLSLEKERDSAVNRLELSAIRQQIDWGSVFDNFGVMFREQVQPTIDRLKTIARSPEFQSSAGVDEMEALYGLISSLQQSETMWNGEIFRQINDDLVSYQNAMRGYMAAQQREIEATEELARAKQTLKEAEGSGDARSIEAAELYVGEAAKNLDKASRDVQMFGTQVQSTTTSLRESSEQAAGMFRNLESGLRNLSSGNLKGIGQGVMQLDKLFNGGKLTEKLGGSLAEGFEKIFGDSSVTQALAEGLGNSGLAGSIISAILSILDELATEGIGGIVAGLTDTVLGAVSGIIDNIFSLELFQQIGESLLKGAANILDALSFGGLGKLVGNGDSDPHLEEDMERLSLTNEALIAAIESLTEEIKGSSGQQATELYEKQMERLDEAEAHTREQMQRSSSAYSNGLWGIGGKKSSNKKIDDAMSGNDWQRISEVVGRTIGEAADFWNLSSEEMAKVAREAPDLYAKIKDYADAGYKDAARYMDDYIAFAEQRKELEQAYYESITQVSFDSVYDSFTDMLMDMSSDWENFSDDMSEYLMRALLKTKLDELLKPQMEEWYAEFGKAMSNGELTDDELELLNKMWKEMVDRGLEIRDSVAASTGYTGDDGGTTQSGKPGGFAAMSQEQGTKLEGLFVSGQMHWASIDERMQDVSEQMGAAVDHLRRIEENTGASAKHLGEIKDEIKKIVRDGLKMK